MDKYPQTGGPQAEEGTLTYAVVIERSTNGYSGYVPDLPGCVAAGDSLEETERLLREAVTFHIECLREHGDPVPEPQTSVGSVNVPASQPG
ncbi:type II toxin-antitoxin system HicB family antitoxin [Candidatus Palauibacter sp.]|uniref:type II toxin-antitoxin system HicB family antitoxin n=1 Tax=Candidatus Palauibacter sp. TaxID=3101350 RepID=UPI003C6F36C6